MRNVFRKNILIFAILGVALFFRVYHGAQLFQFGHEQDLQAWIVKDIVVDHHLRLIGQETSITGVFIGPLYYYVLAVFFWLFGMSPLASIIPVTIVALLTVGSIYYVFSKLYGKEAGYIGSFIYAISLPIALLDRWAVPTQPTLLWTIWFLYVVFTFARGNFKTTTILILLISFIWYVHIAFIPLLVLVPVAFCFSRRPVNGFIEELKKKKNLIAIGIAIILLTPFVVFEFRHGFQQIHSLLSASRSGATVLYGVYRQQIILQNVNRVLTNFIFQTHNFNFPMIGIVPVSFIVFLLVVAVIFREKQFSAKETILVYLWIADVFFVQVISHRPVEEYYFNNLIIVSLLVLAVLSSYLYRAKQNRYVLLGFGILFLLSNAYTLIVTPPLVDEYVDRENVVKFIATDYKSNNYKCVGITYIGAPGVSYGYRYLFWWNSVKLVSPGNGVSVYNLAIPSIISPDEVVETFGTIGVILPKNFKINPAVCDDPSRQLESLNGFLN